MAYKRVEKGQTLVLYMLVCVGLIAIMGLAVDLGMLVYQKIHAQGALSNACVYAANTLYQGGNATSALYQSLAANNIPVEGYQPTTGSGSNLVRGISFGTGSIRTAIRYDTQTYFLQVIGLDTMTVTARARCSTTGTRLTPIAVKYSSWDLSYNGSESVAVLGQGAEADIDSGANYRGAVYPFLWCVQGPSDMTPDPNCEFQQPFSPITQSPPSAQTLKDAIAECWGGIACNRVLAPVGTRLPIVSGTSNAQLVKSAKDAGLVVGTQFVAMIYDGEVTSPDPSYGNWENVAIIGYALFEVTKASNNTLEARALTEIYTSIEDIFYMSGRLFYPNEIPWDATTGW